MNITILRAPTPQCLSMSPTLVLGASATSWWCFMRGARRWASWFRVLPAVGVGLVAARRRPSAVSDRSCRRRPQLVLHSTGQRPAMPTHSSFGWGVLEYRQDGRSSARDRRRPYRLQASLFSWHRCFACRTPLAASRTQRFEPGIALSSEIKLSVPCERGSASVGLYIVTAGPGSFTEATRRPGW